MLNARSAWVAIATRSRAVALLLPALASLAAPTVTVSVITVPPATPTFTRTCNWKLLILPAATLGLVQVTVPVAPTAGVTHVQPAGDTRDWKVVFTGTTSE